jgi:hypothetical protein
MAQPAGRHEVLAIPKKALKKQRKLLKQAEAS